MKNEILNDGFESFLKENADDFLMVPSRKVWYSIYNNMHPDRKWPSMAVCLLILSAVLYIGISNNNSLSIASQKAGSENFTGNIAEVVSPNTNSQTQKSRTASVRNTGSASTYNVSFPLGNNSDAFGITADKTDYPNTDIATVSSPVFENELNNNAAQASGNRILQSVAGRSALGIHKGVAEGSDIDKEIQKAGKDITGENDDIGLSVADNNKKKITLNESAIAQLTADYDRSWKEDYAFRNKPLAKKSKDKLSISYYITPSFGYRGFFRNKEAKAAALYNTPMGKETLNDGAALNLEVGAAINYKVSRSVRLKGGLQMNYTNYVSKVTGLEHPTQAALAAGNNSTYRPSEYAVKAGLARLNKTTLQISMPVGADLKIAGRGKVKWYAGATIQPTHVLSGSAYVLSADGKNYISETPLLRKWNMNTAVETFVTFKPSTGVTVSMGPQFRYQLLSTYKKEYNYTEKLYNIGFKIGLTTDF